MKRLLITTFLLIFLLTACIPTDVGISSQNTTPIVEEQTKNLADSSLNKKTISTTSSNMNNSSPTVAPEALKKGKSKDTTVQVTSTNPDFIATEITGNPTDTSINVNVVPAIPMEIYYEYGTTSGIFSNKTSPQTAVAGSPLVTLISGLKPNTRYYYRIHYGTLEGQEHTFMTQRIPGSTFTFDIQGDSHPERVNQQFNSDLYKRLCWVQPLTSLIFI
jgi:hypothetical protein